MPICIELLEKYFYDIFMLNIFMSHMGVTSQRPVHTLYSCIAFCHNDMQ